MTHRAKKKQLKKNLKTDTCENIRQTEKNFHFYPFLVYGISQVFVYGRIEIIENLIT